MDKIVDQLTHSRLRVTAREPRGKHYYNGASGKGGPDATFVHPDDAPMCILTYPSTAGCPRNCH